MTFWESKQEKYWRIGREEFDRSMELQNIVSSKVSSSFKELELRLYILEQKVKELEDRK